MDGKLNGNTWKVVLPIVLCFIGIVNSYGVWVVNDLKSSIRIIEDKASAHRNDPGIHRAALTRLETDLDWIKKEVSEVKTKVDFGIQISNRLEHSLKNGKSSK